MCAPTPQISLPQKKEIILYSSMTETQLRLNKQMMDRTLMVSVGHEAAPQPAHVLAGCKHRQPSKKFGLLM